MRESVDWSFDGRLVRRRELLGQTIVTTVEADAGTETLSGTTVNLSAAELQQLRAEPARHPLAILAAHVRGELPFEYVAKRAVEDREHVVLQALGGRGDRLRIHVDADSHLVRRVELWATLQDGSVVRIEEAWSDYRPVAGLRVPYCARSTRTTGRTASKRCSSRSCHDRAPGERPSRWATECRRQTARLQDSTAGRAEPQHHAEVEHVLAVQVLVDADRRAVLVVEYE